LPRHLNHAGIKGYCYAGKRKTSRRSRKKGRHERDGRVRVERVEMLKEILTIEYIRKISSTSWMGMGADKRNT